MMLEGFNTWGLECAMNVRHAIIFRMDCVIAIQLYSVILIRSIFYLFFREMGSTVQHTSHEMLNSFAALN